MKYPFEKNINKYIQICSMSIELLEALILLIWKEILRGLDEKVKIWNFSLGPVVLSNLANLLDAKSSLVMCQGVNGLTLAKLKLFARWRIIFKLEMPSLWKQNMTVHCSRVDQILHMITCIIQLRKRKVQCLAYNSLCRILSHCKRWMSEHKNLSTVCHLPPLINIWLIFFCQNSV